MVFLGTATGAAHRPAAGATQPEFQSVPERLFGNQIHVLLAAVDDAVLSDVMLESTVPEAVLFMVGTLDLEELKQRLVGTVLESCGGGERKKVQCNTRTHTHTQEHKNPHHRRMVRSVARSELFQIVFVDCVNACPVSCDEFI